APEIVNSSVWQMPVALISTSTSPSRGPSRSTSTISSGLAFSKATAARVFISTILPDVFHLDRRAFRRDRLGALSFCFAHRIIRKPLHPFRSDALARTARRRPVCLLHEGQPLRTPDAFAM